MKQRKMSTGRMSRINKQYRIGSLALMAMGAVIVVFALIYLLVNLNNADSIILISAPLLIIGMALIVLSLIIDKFKKRN